MMRALDLAAEARGRTSPNPMVGAVVVGKEGVVGEGCHLRVGEDHAEVRALAAAGRGARGADLYVNLEPCSHHGRTPPCTEAIKGAGVRRVFAAIKDPNPLVAGKGARELRRAGISVRFGLAAPEARRLNEAFLKYIRTGMPFVFLKTAVSLDGKTATRKGDSRWISNALARARVHELRDGADAIMVGIGTVLADDPQLTTRLPEGGGRSPHRIVIDPLLRTPSGARVLAKEAGSRTILVAGEGVPAERIDRLESRGAEVMIMKGEGPVLDMGRLMRRLGKMEMTSVMVEGGSEVAASLLSAGVVDKVVYFIAPKIVGGREAPGAVGGEGAGLMREALGLKDLRVTALGDNIMVEGYLRQQGESCSQD